ncbi:MAG: hypothetical protein F9K29_11580 [Hyphomicrobiaceae bacterium]|nr:MAG: hypothetical protein F9K29_11580 [Hyphomicrobiaceae bacterium]
MLGLRSFISACGFVVVAVVALPASVADMAPGDGAAAPESDPAALAESGDDRPRSIDGPPLAVHAAVGRITGTMVCTAAIVLHPRIIITAAHCLTGQDGMLSRARATFQPARRAGLELDRFEASVWAIGAPQRPTGQSAHEAANDWAILVLDREPMGVRPVPMQSLSVHDLTQLERQVLMPSYASDDAGVVALSVDPACSVRGAMWNVLLHDCRASAGASGAPLLIPDGQWYALVGVHSSSIAIVDADNGASTFVRYSAIGTWAFAAAIEKLSERLNSGGDPLVSTALAH